MPRIRRLLEAASELSTLLTAAGVVHAFHGGFLAVLLGSSRDTEDLCVLVQGGFRPVRDAVAGSDKFTATNAPWSARLFVTYQHAIPSIDIEVKMTGEEGPRRLDQHAVMSLQNITWLSVTEFVRAKLRDWTLRARAEDAHDIAFILGQFHANIDINRMPEQEMARYLTANPAAAPAWQAIRARYQ